MDNHTASIILNMLSGISAGKVKTLLHDTLEPKELFTQSDQFLSHLPGMTRKILYHLQNWQNYCDPEVEKQKAERSGIYIITPENSFYPPLLREISDPPLCLYVRGALAALEKSIGSIAIVGSRHTTQYGEKMAHFLASEAALAGWPVISGLARGIDTISHRTALQNHGITLAILGSGLFNLYPKENFELAKEICTQGGAILSEFPLDTKPDRYNFPIRNRIISGISRGTIVIEAGLQSGSLITAHSASEQNRAVFAVPGRADSPFSKGCHALIQDGAKLVEQFQDVVDEFTFLPGLEPPGRQKQIREQIQKMEVLGSPPVELPELEYRIWKQVSLEDIPLDNLITTLNLPASKVLSTILLLEMKNLLKQLPGKLISANPSKKAKKKT